MNRYLKISLCLFGITLLVTGIGIGQQENTSEDTTEGKEPGLVQDVSSFITSTSPAFLIIMGIILIVGSGFAKLIGYILIVYSIIRLLLTLL